MTNGGISMGPDGNGRELPGAGRVAGGGGSVIIGGAGGGTAG